MGRPRCRRKINFNPTETFFKPQGVPLKDLNSVEIYLDELEALRLFEVEGLNMKKGAEYMGISDTTFHRLVRTGSKKIILALVNGFAIKLNKI
ncbi:MAG: DUF134 domain-containing protein [Candidatus Gracilibacteria bacterium]|nr:DUF134 domain-containing protein [Candidatus Gracilibacteria bacterium]MDD4530575.1 DUF134 domain-containing protein [Candidatus Gracilibacteria bacterium]